MIHTLSFRSCIRDLLLPLTAVNEILCWTPNSGKYISTFQHIIKTSGKEELDKRLAYLSTVDKLKFLTTRNLHKIVDLLEEEDFEEGDHIIHQGTLCKYRYRHQLSFSISEWQCKQMFARETRCSTSLSDRLVTALKWHYL